jgi:hypothetical protein
MHKYLDIYVFRSLHELFFYEFSHLLQKWLLRLKEKNPTNQMRQKEWHPMEITQLHKVNNKFTCTIDFWLDNIIARFITEFSLDTTNS